MERLLIAILAILVATIVYVGAIPTVQAMVMMFVSEHRVVLGLAAICLTIAACMTVGWRAGLVAAPWETPES